VDDVPLELGEGGHHGEEELALAGRRVAAGQLASEDPDADAAGMEVVSDCEHLLDRAAETVELPDDQGVTGAQVVKRGDEARTVRRSLAGADLLDVDPGAPGLRQGILLKLGVLGVGADAGQADEVALTVGEVERGEGLGGDGGLCHIPSVSKQSHNF
jgi:hypothetical protein